MKNIKKSENETSEVVLKSIKKLFDEGNADIPDACIDRAHRVSKTNNTFVARFTAFRHHTMFYRNRKALRSGLTVHLDLIKSRLDLLMKANKYVKDISNDDDDDDDDDDYYYYYYYHYYYYYYYYYY